MTPITLVSMAPSGETFITRDGRGRLWLHKPQGAAGAGQIDRATAALAVAKHGFEPIGQEFVDWPSLDDFRQARAALVTPATIIDRDALDMDDVHEMLDTGREWASEGMHERAHRLATSLLRVPAVVGDAEVRDEVLRFLEELGPGRVVPLRAPAHPDYLQRWHQVHTAA